MATVMMPGAKRSPRIENYILYWYQGNTFSYIWTLSLTDPESQEPVEINPTDIVTFNFYKRGTDLLIYAFSCTNIVKNEQNVYEVTLEFTSDISKRFKPGLYSYCVTYNNGTAVTTIGADLLAEVEQCH